MHIHDAKSAFRVAMKLIGYSGKSAMPSYCRLIMTVSNWVSVGAGPLNDQSRIGSTGPGTGHKCRRWADCQRSTRSRYRGPRFPSGTARQACASAVRDDRAFRVAVDHQMVVAVLGHRRLQIGHPGLDRLIDGEVEESREFPQRLVRPPCATRPKILGGPNTIPMRRTSPVMGQASTRVVTATYSMS